MKFPILTVILISCLSFGASFSEAQLFNEVAAITKKIDELVEAKLVEIGQKRNREIDDEVFVRRIYLDVTGRIPTLEETGKFLASKSKTKRAELIDQLLDSYGHVSRQFNYWADVLRVRSRNNRIYGQTYINFLKDSLEQNQPYDQFVRELLTSEGTMFDPDHGAVGYYLRDINMPEDNMSNTVRVFLGTRLECAQCHDHPYDVWTQRDYFEMVAFTGGMKFRDQGLIGGLDRSERKELKEFSKSEPGKFVRTKRLLRAIETGVFGSGTGLARLPEGFMGAEGDENEIITGKTMFDRQSLVNPKIPTSKQSRKRRKNKKNSQQIILGAKDLGSRTAYANWMTSPDNPRFATTIANRLWKQSMGLGLIEPVDTIDDSTTASNGALMEFLAASMVALDFDRKAFLRAIYNSRTYQSQASSADITDVASYGFNGPVLRRMTAEQLWDSLVALAMPDVDRRSETAYSPIDSKRNVMIQAISADGDVSVQEIIELANMESKGNLKKMRRKFADQVKDARRESMLKVRALNKKVNQARSKGNLQLVNELMIQRAQEVASMKAKTKFGGLKRASELSSPAPAGHFLREFGQSDREQIENANSEPAVTQVLSMMNGFIENSIAKDKNTVLMSNVLKANRSDVIDVIYLTMLARRPTGKELRTWAPDFDKDPVPAYNDLIWTIANSNEFIFVK